MKSWKQRLKGQGKQVGLNKKNGTLKGVDVQIYEGGNWKKTGAVGWRLSDGSFFIGIDELEDGYGYITEIVISEKALLRMLTYIKPTSSRNSAQDAQDVADEAKRFSEEYRPNKWDWLEGDYPA